MTEHLVCLTDDWWFDGGLRNQNPNPVKGEIYTFDGVHEKNNRYIFLKEFHYLNSGGKRISFLSTCFRPVDSEFGPAICERVEDQINYEIAIEASVEPKKVNTKPIYIPTTQTQMK